MVIISLSLLMLLYLYCLNCLHFFRMENKLMSHEQECKNEDLTNQRILY